MQETPQQYTQRILGNVEGQDPIRVQKSTAGRIAKAIKGLRKKQLGRRPAPGKWSITEIIAHLSDAEIAGSWRMRLILGQDGVAVQAFDQDAWASTFNYQKADAKTALETFRVLRENNLVMLKSLPKNLWDNYGMHQERGRESIAHIVRMFAGHDLNHVKQIEQIAKAARKR